MEEKQLDGILDGWVELATQDPLVGKQFREYAILSCIGSGGIECLIRVKPFL